MKLSRWIPALAAGLIAWLAFMILGHTPVIRASGLALAIIGAALMFSRWGMILGVVGGLAFAFSPAFWAQTGGTESLNPVAVSGALALAVVGAAFLAWLSKRPSFGLALGLIVFTGLFFTVVGSPHSLRLTTLLAAWLLALVVDALMLTNPRPDEAAPISLGRRHVLGILLLLTIGVINDPLIALFLPAVALGLFLSATKLPRWYWAALLVIGIVGARGLMVQYADSSWWLYPAAQAEMLSVRVPKLFADGWRVSERWVELFALVIDQFSVVGLVLGVIGLARLARWYPTLGVVMLTAFTTYFIFGLLYFGRDRAVLLLPLLMIQVLWMTYALHSIWQWLTRSLRLFAPRGKPVIAGEPKPPI